MNTDRMDNEKANTNPSREKLFMFWNSVRRIVTDLDVHNTELTEDHENHIRRYYDQLLSNLNVPDVVTQMFKSGKLTAKEHEHIRQFYSTPIRASEELLNIITVKSRDVYECFLESLKKTKQHHVYQMLTSDEETLCMDDQSVSEHSRVIRQNYVLLTEKLNPDSGLLAILYAKEVLSQREYGQVAFEKDPFAKNEILLSIISRKSFEDFEKFKSALNDTSQGHIANKLKETPLGDENQILSTKIAKSFLTTCSDSLGKRIPPKPPPKPKKQLPTSPFSKPMVIKSLLDPKIHPSKPNRTEKRQIVTKHKIAKKQSVQYLEAKFRELPNELQAEVSTKLLLIHRRETTDNIWKISFTKILQESRNIKRRSIMQAKATNEYCERLKQEIIQRELESKIIKEDIQREKTRTKEQLRELQETVCELEDSRNLTENENKNLFAKLKNSEVEIEVLKLLNKKKEQEANEKVIITEKLEKQVAYSEMKLQISKAELSDTKDKLFEKDTVFQETVLKLEENQEMLKETNVKLDELKAQLRAAEKCNDNLKVLNERKEKDVNEKVGLGIIEKLEGQVTYSETELQETQAQFRDTRNELIEKDLTLAETTRKLEETEKKFKETGTKLTEFGASLITTQTNADNLTSEDVPKDKYKSGPVLVHTIRTNSGIKKKLKIFGVTMRRHSSIEGNACFGFTILDKELFAVSDESSKIKVYDSIKFSFSRRWILKELIDPTDIVSCNKNKCLYIFDYKGDNQSKEILRVDANGKLIKKWSTGDDDGHRLSVTDESNVLFPVYNKNKLNEYSPDGQLIREINLLSDANIRHPWHAIKLVNGQYLVCHGTYGDDLHRVCTVDADGKLIKSFGGRPGSAFIQMNAPFHLFVDENGFVMVADFQNRRVLLLDSDLDFKREILSEETHGLRHPQKILLDESSNRRLFVAQNELYNQKILIFDLNEYVSNIINSLT